MSVGARRTAANSPPNPSMSAAHTKLQALHAPETTHRPPFFAPTVPPSAAPPPPRPSPPSSGQNCSDRSSPHFTIPTGPSTLAPTPASESSASRRDPNKSPLDYASLITETSIHHFGQRCPPINSLPSSLPNILNPRHSVAGGGPRHHAAFSSRPRRAKSTTIILRWCVHRSPTIPYLQCTAPSQKHHPAQTTSSTPDKLYFHHHTFANGVRPPPEIGRECVTVGDPSPPSHLTHPPLWFDAST